MGRALLHSLQIFRAIFDFENVRLSRTWLNVVWFCSREGRQEVDQEVGQGDGGDGSEDSEQCHLFVSVSLFELSYL